MTSACFHLSILAQELELTRRWYERVLGSVAGRSSAAALILNLGGHQLVAQHQPLDPEPLQRGNYPRHFGLVVPSLESWQALRERVGTTGEGFRWPRNAASWARCWSTGPLSDRSLSQLAGVQALPAPGGCTGLPRSGCCGRSGAPAPQQSRGLIGRDLLE